MAAGRLYTSSVEMADLGSHAGLRLRGCVRRRELHLALDGVSIVGGRRGGPRLSLSLGRLRPFAVEVTDRSGTRVVPFRVAPHPAEQAALRLALVALGCLAALALARGLRGR